MTLFMTHLSRRILRRYDLNDEKEKPTIALETESITLYLQAPGNRNTIEQWRENILMQAIKVEGALLRTRSARKIHLQIARPRAVTYHSLCTILQLTFACLIINSGHL